MGKNKKKLFTNSKSNNIIKVNNPLKANKIGKEGLPMRKNDVVILEEIKKGLTIEEIQVLKKHTEICIKIYKKGIEKGFNAKM